MATARNTITQALRSIERGTPNLDDITLILEQALADLPQATLADYDAPEDFIGHWATIVGDEDHLGIIGDLSDRGANTSNPYIVETHFTSLGRVTPCPEYVPATGNDGQPFTYPAMRAWLNQHDDEGSAIPRGLSSLDDYADAPVGTIVAHPNSIPYRKDHEGEWVSENGRATDFQMNCSTNGYPRDVLRWGIETSDVAF